MDPVATLKRLRELALEMEGMEEDDLAFAADEMSELFIALDEWMIKGGFSPWTSK